MNEDSPFIFIIFLILGVIIGIFLIIDFVSGSQIIDVLWSWWTNDVNSFFDYFLGMFGRFLYFLITLISTPFWYKIGKSYSNMFLLQVGTLITMIGFFPVLLIHSQNWELYIVVIFITGIGIGIDLIIPQIELANILDDNQDNRLSQIFTAFFSIIKKAAIGIAGGISLTGYGYLEKIEFSLNSFIPNIMIFYFFIPIIIKLIVLFLVMRYRSKFDVSAQS